MTLIHISPVIFEKRPNFHWGVSMYKMVLCPVYYSEGRPEGVQQGL